MARARDAVNKLKENAKKVGMENEIALIEVGKTPLGPEHRDKKILIIAFEDLQNIMQTARDFPEELYLVSLHTDKTGYWRRPECLFLPRQSLQS